MSDDNLDAEFVRDQPPATASALASLHDEIMERVASEHAAWQPKEIGVAAADTFDAREWLSGHVKLALADLMKRLGSLAESKIIENRELIVRRVGRPLLEYLRHLDDLALALAEMPPHAGLQNGDVGGLWGAAESPGDH